MQLACTTEGSPKPRISSHYANYKTGVYEFDTSQTHDMAWMVARFCNRTACSDSEAVCDPETPRSPNDPTFNDKAERISLNGLAGNNMRMFRPITRSCNHHLPQILKQ